jgi:multicomponent K+:H+ antiporter subunit E
VRRLSRRIVPHPLLTLTLAAVWVLLVNEPTLGAALLGLLLGVVLPLATAPFWPDRPVVRGPLRIAEYAAIVLWDICVANVEVARLILFRRADELRSAFVAVPLELRTPEAIAALAGTITMTPGTVSADLSADGRSLLVHALEVEDDAALVAGIKERYERRLKEIFEP